MVYIAIYISHYRRATEVTIRNIISIGRRRIGIAGSITTCKYIIYYKYGIGDIRTAVAIYISNRQRIGGRTTDKNIIYYINRITYINSAIVIGIATQIISLGDACCQAHHDDKNGQDFILEIPVHKCPPFE
jgi:hypothetical protein